MGGANRKWGHLIGQALLVGVALFVISLLLRVALDTMLEVASAGPPAPASSVGIRSMILMTVIFAPVVETPFVVYLVRRVDRERESLALWIMVVIIAAGAWLFHGASPGSVGQGAAFALMAYMA